MYFINLVQFNRRAVAKLVEREENILIYAIFTSDISLLWHQWNNVGTFLYHSYFHIQIETQRDEEATFSSGRLWLYWTHFCGTEGGGVKQFGENGWLKMINHIAWCFCRPTLVVATGTVLPGERRCQRTSSRVGGTFLEEASANPVVFSLLILVSVWLTFWCNESVTVPKSPVDLNVILY